MIAFEATEDVRWRLTAIAPAGLPNVVAESGAFARVHSAHVHGLRASLLGRPLWHTLVLTLVDRSGLTQTFTLSDPLATLPDRNGNLPLLPPRAVVTQLEAFNRAVVGAGVSATVRVQVGAFDDPLQQPMADWIVIAQVLRRAGSDESWQTVPKAEIRHDGPNWIVATQQSMELDRLWNGAPYPTEAVPGHLVTFPATVAPGGFATLRVGVTTLAAGAEAALHVVAVLPASANRGTASAPEFPLVAFGSWPLGATAPTRREVRLNP